MALKDEVCVPCREGSPTLKAEEISALLAGLPDWKVVDGLHLHRPRISHQRSPGSIAQACYAKSRVIMEILLWVGVTWISTSTPIRQEASHMLTRF
jgi:hypothetical protein